MMLVGKTKRLLIFFALLLLIFSAMASGLTGNSSKVAAASSCAGVGKGYNYVSCGSGVVIEDGVGTTSEFKQDSSNNNQFDCSSSGCTSSNYFTPPYITISTSDCSQGTLTEESTGNTHTGTPPTTTKSTVTINNTVLLENNYFGINCALPANITGPAGAATKSPSTSTTPSCEESGGALDWIYCAGFDVLNSITQLVLTKFIQPELNTDTICVSGTGNGCTAGDPTYQIWASFRLYGDIVLVIALLIVVISEALGGGLVDAYTVRKMLPRLLAAGILLNISIYLVAGLVDITNIIGGSIGAVITAPLNNAGAFAIHPNGVVSFGGWLVAATAVTAVGLFVVDGTAHPAITTLFSKAGGTFLIDMVLVPALLIFLAILLTIVIRKLAIISLIIIAPLAFAMYCLPNTQRYFKRWWDMLVEMLMVYPIIMLIFAVSSVLSVIVTLPSASSGPGGAAASDLQGGINALLALVFTVLPLALVPFSFKLAGDTVGKLYAAVDAGRKKAMDMHAGRRKRALEGLGIKYAGEKAKASSRWDEMGRKPGIGRIYRGRGAKADAGIMIAADEVSKQPGFAAMKDNPGVMMAAAMGESEYAKHLYAKTVQLDAQGNVIGNKWNDKKVSAEEARRFSAEKARQDYGRGKAVFGEGVAQRVAAAKALVAQGPTLENVAEMSRIAAQAAQGNEQLKEHLAGAMSGIAGQVGRQDLAAGFTRTKEAIDAADKVRTGTAQPGEFENAMRNAVLTAFETNPLNQTLGGRSKSMEDFMTEFKDIMNHQGNHSQNTIDRAMRSMEELHNALQNPSQYGMKNDVLDVLTKEENIGVLDRAHEQYQETIKAMKQPGITLSPKEFSRLRQLEAYRKSGNVPYDIRSGEPPTPPPGGEAQH